MAFVCECGVNIKILGDSHLKNCTKRDEKEGIGREIQYNDMVIYVIYTYF